MEMLRFMVLLISLETLHSGQLRRFEVLLFMGAFDGPLNGIGRLMVMVRLGGDAWRGKTTKHWFTAKSLGEFVIWSNNAGTGGLYYASNRVSASVAQTYSFVNASNTDLHL